MQAAGLVWLMVTATFLLRLMAGAFWFNFRLARSRSGPDPGLIELASELRRKVRTFWRPEIVETPLIHSPVLFGCFRPRLLLPRNFPKSLSKIELRHLFLHELGHLKRGDLFVNAFMAAAQALHWFNPVVWMVLRRMRMERELACDQFALEVSCREGNEARAYGETLLKLLATFRPQPNVRGMLGILEEKEAAILRLRAIAAFVPAQRQFWKIGLPLLLMLAAVGLTNAQTTRTRPAKNPITETRNVSAGELREDRTGQGVVVLEQEFKEQKKKVETAQKGVDELRESLDLRASEWTSLSNGGSSWREFEPDRVVVTGEMYSYLNGLLQQLKKLNRTELRRALPTVIPDAALDRNLAALAEAGQKLASISNDYSENHPEVFRLRGLIKTIEGQIEDRVSGILAGLEVKVAALKNQPMEEGTLGQTRDSSVSAQQRFAPYFRAKRALENEQRILDTIFMRILAERVDEQLSRDGTHPSTPERSAGETGANSTPKPE